MADLSINVLRYGRQEALPETRTLRAGPISLLYTADGDLRNIRLGNQEILNRLYVAVRDHNWNTIPVELSNVEIDDQGDAFHIRYDATHRQGNIDFFWQGHIDGEADGTLRFAMDGEARSTFLSNRIGFCILHPATCAGKACKVEHVDGSAEAGEFPRYISPHQPFFAIRAITHEVIPGVEAEVRMEGETFEMEDQRNWTDASYKTYSTPLALPFPVEVPAGKQERQLVSITLRGDLPEATSGEERESTFHVGEMQMGALPRLGLGLSTQESSLDRKEIERLRALHIAHLRVDIDFAQPDWDDHLRRAADEADAVGSRLEVAIHLSDQAEEQLKALRDLIQEIRPPVQHWLIFHVNEKETGSRWLELARQYLGDYDRAADIGAGTNNYFTELNRNRPHAEVMDLVCYSINPQVHAFDNRSLMETLPVQATTVESARQFVGDRPLAITPITLRPRFNPNATGAEEASEESLPSQVDERQMSRFAAAWIVGSLKSMAESSVAHATYYETVGWRGVMETREGSPMPEQFRSIPGGVYPLYHIIADVAGCAGAPALAGCSSDPMRVDGLVFRRNNKVRILLANMTNDTQEVTVIHGGQSARFRVLDEENAVDAMSAPERFRAQEEELPSSDGQSRLRLLPYAVATLDVEAT
jgi:D-apionolactonase